MLQRRRLLSALTSLGLLDAALAPQLAAVLRSMKAEGLHACCLAKARAAQAREE